MNQDNIDYDELLNDMKLKNKIELFFRLNHYIAGPVTVTDVIILLTVFLGVGYFLNMYLHLNIAPTFLVTLCLCAVIEYFRIKWRKAKTLQYIEKKSAQIKKLLDEYSRFVETQGTEEAQKDFEEIRKKFDLADEVVRELSDLTYEKDVLGLTDDEES